jgi:hypothetical protein
MAHVGFSEDLNGILAPNVLLAQVTPASMHSSRAEIRVVRGRNRTHMV